MRWRKKEKRNRKGKINDGARRERTVEKRKNANVLLYPRMGKDVTKRKEKAREKKGDEAIREPDP